MQKIRDNRLSPEVERQRQGQLLDLLAPFANCKPAFSYSASNRCADRGLIPLRLLNELEMVEFLCATVLSAQKAQRAYGVRASVLLAMALAEACGNARDLTGGPNNFDDYNGPSTSPEIDQWFLDRAKRLTGKRFQKALSCLNAKSYLMALCELGYLKRLVDAEDLWTWIEDHELEKCDLAGLLPIGEYSSAKYDEVRDAAGNVTGLKLSEYWITLIRRQTAAA